MVRSKGDISLKNTVTPPGIDPGTVRLVAQRLNHYDTPGPRNTGKALVLKKNRKPYVEASSVRRSVTQYQRLNRSSEFN
jgi:hypothetical protein